MAEWSFDITKAPRGKYRIVALANGKGTRRVFEPVPIIAAGRGGAVTVTRWVDDQNRFDMFSAEYPPFAWMPYAGPRKYVDEKGKTRYAVDLPPHPYGEEPWHVTFMREVGSSLPPNERQRACLAWIAARYGVAV